MKQEHLPQLEEHLKERVIGQDDAVAVVAQEVRMARVGLKGPGRPAAVFLFAGPRGVGKKSLARALAEFLFGPENKMLYLEMSEYTEQHHVRRLIGPSLDYIRPDEGILDEWLRRQPYSIVLMEDVEKAHPDVLDFFGHLFRGERLTDFMGRLMDARHTIFIMTTTLTQEDGFNRQRMLAHLEKIFPPEFLHCIDEIVSFRPLEPDSVLKIASNLLNGLCRRLEEQQNISFEVDDKALQLICHEGYHPEHGVSLMERAIDRLIITPLSKKVLTGEFSSGDKVLVTIKDGQTDLMKVE